MFVYFYEERHVSEEVQELNLTSLLTTEFVNHLKQSVITSQCPLSNKVEHSRVETEWFTCKNLQVSCKKWLTCKNLKVSCTRLLSCKNLQVEWLTCKNLQAE